MNPAADKRESTARNVRREIQDEFKVFRKSAERGRCTYARNDTDRFIRQSSTNALLEMFREISKILSYKARGWTRRHTCAKCLAKRREDASD